MEFNIEGLETGLADGDRPARMVEEFLKDRFDDLKKEDKLLSDIDVIVVPCRW